MQFLRMDSWRQLSQRWHFINLLWQNSCHPDGKSVKVSLCNQYIFEGVDVRVRVNGGDLRVNGGGEVAHGVNHVFDGLPQHGRLLGVLSLHGIDSRLQGDDIRWRETRGVALVGRIRRLENAKSIIIKIFYFEFQIGARISEFVEFMINVA